MAAAELFFETRGAETFQMTLSSEETSQGPKLTQNTQDITPSQHHFKNVKSI